MSITHGEIRELLRFEGEDEEDSWIIDASFKVADKLNSDEMYKNIIAIAKRSVSDRLAEVLLNEASYKTHMTTASVPQSELTIRFDGDLTFKVYLDKNAKEIRDTILAVASGMSKEDAAIEKIAQMAMEVVAAYKTGVAHEILLPGNNLGLDEEHAEKLRAYGAELLQDARHALEIYKSPAPTKESSR